MSLKFKPYCDVLWLGSYPLLDAKKAIKLYLNYPNIIPHWPQLPRKSNKERMLDQTIAAMEKPNGQFPMGYASGWNTAFKMLAKKKNIGPYFKTHITGPLTVYAKFGLKKSKQNKKKKSFSSIELLMYSIDLWLKHAFWQIETIQEKGYIPILILDEPMLPTILSPSTGTRFSKVLKLFQSMIQRLQKKGALIGIHCCNRVSPEVLIKTGVDLIHFDTIHFNSLLMQSKEAIRNFLKEDGIIAWGIISTTDPIDNNSIQKTIKYFMEYLESLETKSLPLKKILSLSMISPICGTGYLKPEHSQKILDTTANTSNLIKNRYQLTDQ